MSADNVTPIRPGIAAAEAVKNPKARRKGPSRQETEKFRAAIGKLSAAQKLDLLKFMRTLERPKLAVDNTRKDADD